MIGVVCPYCDKFLDNKDGLDHLDQEIEKVNCKIMDSLKSALLPNLQRYVNTLTVLLARRHILHTSLKGQTK
jgi:hypothetical protein